ncbi:hypothetical protein Ahy_A07g033733 [Arachis hypogaea]|uniref:Protein FAR1-RELATED SEQUENCE n=1 Tax=Arachis hypogaea TaxID=3818 RepID=A0A445C9Z7_ARAHY|nr:hypothetical protein Ahy_A07g033733 [Arachis hypogaea]
MINAVRSRLYEQVSNSTSNKFAVTYDLCLLLKSRGILCRHSLSVLSFERNIKRRHTHIKSSHDEPILESRKNICEFASESEELTGILHRTYDNAIVEMQEHKAKRKEKCSLSYDDASLEDINELQNPPRVRTRRHPKNRLGLNTKNTQTIQYLSSVEIQLTKFNKDLICCSLPIDVEVWCFDIPSLSIKGQGHELSSFQHPPSISSNTAHSKLEQISEFSVPPPTDHHRVFRCTARPLPRVPPPSFFVGHSRLHHRGIIIPTHLHHQTPSRPPSVATQPMPSPHSGRVINYSDP